MKRFFTKFLTIIVLAVLPMAIQAQIPQSGTFKIKNAETGKYVSVISKYYAKPSVEDSEASEIGMTVGYKLEDNSYRLVALNATALDGTAIEAFDYIDKAHRIAMAMASEKMQSLLTRYSQIVELIQEDIEGDLPLPATISEAAQEEIKAMIDSVCTIYLTNYGYFAIEPVEGTPDNLTVKATASIPSIPHSAEAAYTLYVAVMKALANTEGRPEPQYPETIWDWAKAKVIEYLDSHGTDATLKSYVKANLDKVEPGTKYWLTADTDGTFGLESSDTGNNEWVLEAVNLVENDVEPGLYNIQNVSSEKFVHLTGRYYAKPELENDEILDDLTNLLPSSLFYVEMGLYDRNKSDDYRITSLKNESEDVDVVAYINKGIKKATQMVQDKLELVIENSQTMQDIMGILSAGGLTEDLLKEDIATALAECGDYYAFLRLKYNGDEDGYANVSLHLDIPKVPALIEHVYQKVYSRAIGDSNWRERLGIDESMTTFEAWLKSFILSYFENSSNTDNTLVTLVKANINNWTAGQTYYLTDDNDGTFGMGTENGNSAQWLLTEVKGEVDGYFRMANASAPTTDIVKITSLKEAAPNTSEADANKAAGTVWHFKAEGGIISGLTLEMMRSQGADGVAVFNGALAKAKALPQTALFPTAFDETKLKLALTTTEDGNIAYYLFSTSPNVPETYWSQIRTALKEQIGDDNFAAALISASIENWTPNTNYYVADEGQAFAFADESAINADKAKWILQEVESFGVKCVDTPLESTGKYYTTLFVDFPITLAEGVKAYYAADDAYNSETGKISFTPISGDIPAQTALLIECDDQVVDDAITIPTDDVTSTISNSLQGVIDESTGYLFDINEVPDNCYVLGKDKKKKLGFRSYTGLTLVANKAFMVIDKSSTANFSIAFEGETDGIESLPVTEDNANAACYDLQGRRVVNPTQGIYVVNGKKMIKK